MAVLTASAKSGPSATKRARRQRANDRPKQDSQAELRRFFVPSVSGGVVGGGSVVASIDGPPPVAVAAAVAPGGFRVPALPQRKRHHVAEQPESSADVSSMAPDDFEPFFH